MGLCIKSKRKGVSPHRTKAKFVRQVCVMWQQCCEQVLGKCVHGNAFPVNDLTQTAEGTTCTHGKRETHTSVLNSRGESGSMHTCVHLNCISLFHISAL